MKQLEFKEKSFEEVVSELLEEGLVQTKQDIIDFGRSKLDEGDIMTASHVISAVDEDEADYYIYDYSMGTLETPSAVRTKEDVEHLIED